KKRNEIFQMAVLEPKLAVLDETDSGLDIDALKIVANGVNSLRSPDRSMIVVTHYQRLLNYITPDYVHVLSDGRIVRSGGKALALELEAKGYAGLELEAAVSENVMSQASPLSVLETSEQTGPFWLRDIRRDAMRSFSELGFPTTRDEEWRFTNIGPITKLASLWDRPPAFPELPGQGPAPRGVIVTR